MIKVSIIEDQRDMRESLVACLDSAPGVRCVGAHATGEEALRSIPNEHPDVVLMDINLPAMSGIQCVIRLKERLPKIQVLMLTTYDDGDLIFDSLRAGANGYLLKNMPQEEMLQAVQQQVADADIFIAAAAVSDYRCGQVSGEKIKKTSDTMTLALARAPIPCRDRAAG